MRLLMILSFLAAFLTPGIAWTEDGSHGVTLTLRDQGPNGDVQFLIGEGLSNEADTGIIQMTGGVQVRQGQDVLLIADEIEAALTGEGAAQNMLQDVGQLASLQLGGQVFAQIGDTLVEAELVDVDLIAQRLHLPQGPSRLGFAGQVLSIGGQATVDAQRGILQADGGVTLTQGQIWLEVERIQLRRAPDAPDGTLIEVLADGGIRAQGPDFQFQAGRVESSADGNRLYLSGGVTFVGATGSLSAGRMIYHVSTGAFTLDRSSSAPIRGLGFLTL